MVRKCIMVKVGGSKKRKLNANMGKIYTFCGNRGICNMHHWLKGGGGRFWNSDIGMNCWRIVVYFALKHQFIENDTPNWTGSNHVKDENATKYLKIST